MVNQYCLRRMHLDTLLLEEEGTIDEREALPVEGDCLLTD